MPMFTGQDLVEAGWPEEEVPQLLAEVEALEAKGIPNPKYILKLLERKFPKPDKRRLMRETPLAFGEAIAPVTPADENNIASVRRLMSQLMCCPVVEAGAIMPDACPAGNAPATIPVGGVIAVRNAILPGAHSSDICCSLLGTFFSAEADVSEMMDHLMDSTRFGPGGRPEEDRVDHPVIHEDVWNNKFLAGLKSHAEAHMADQGDGNHFAFLGKVSFSPEALDAMEAAGQQAFARSIREKLGAKSECYALVTHHGSRGLGAQLYKRGMAAALKQTEKLARDIPDAAAWLSLDTEQGQDYWEALQYVGRWTRANHESIHQRFLERASATALAPSLSTEHNFVWRRGDLFLHGKGATPAWKDESGHPLLGLIPLNMKNPILLVLGKDNTDYLSFAPHGAGRNFSRRATLNQFKRKDGTMDLAAMNQEIDRSVAGLDVRWYLGKADFSECAPAYKPSAQVRSQIEQFGLADVVAEIEPLGSIMAGRAPSRDEEPLTPKQKRQIQHRADRRKLRQNLRHGDWPADED